jgi:hypothetical protein
MPNCKKCNDTGVIETGNNDLPCDCPAGDTALFNTCGVEGAVTGAEMKRYFLNDSPEPIKKSNICATELPSRIKTQWTDIWPTEAGVYWFYGWRFGRKGLYKDDKPELCLVKVNAIKNGVTYVIDGDFFYAEEDGAVGKWIKAILPELPNLK